MSLEKLITISSDDKDPDSNSNSDFYVSLKERFYIALSFALGFGIGVITIRPFII